MLCRFLLIVSLLTPLTVYADFHISGVPKAIKSKLIDHMKNLEFPCDSSPSASNRILKQSNAELTLALHSLGYFNAQVSQELLFKKKCWQLSYEIQLGDPLLIREANIEITGAAAPEKGFLDLLAKYTMQSGSPFSSETYEQFKETLQARAIRLGYFDAKMLEQRVDIYPHLNVADITLRWHSGQRYLFGELQIDQTVLQDKLFADLLSITPGTPYNLSTLQNDRIRLTESRYFELVEVTPILALQHDGQVPIQVMATAGPPSSYEAGVGFSTDTGPRMRGSYTRHRINDAGHQGEVSLLLSQVLNKVNLNYKVPWHDPRTDSIRADVSFLDERNDSYESQRWETSLTDSMLLSSGWNQALSLTLTTEKSIIAAQEDNSIHLVPGISWSKLSADNLSYPSRGYSLSFAVLGSNEQFVSDSSFLQLQSSAKWVTTLPYKVRLLMRGDFGYTLSGSIDELPSSRRFFTGGDNSIRGYEYQSLGPIEGGEVIGGKHKAVASIELERPVYKKWSLATFVDSGNAWNERFDPVTGVGVGLRWHSPIGPLRFDVAVPLDDDTTNFRIHLSFGAQL